MTTAEDLIHQLERTRDETLRYFSLGDADLARKYAPGSWSVRFILHHLADSETVLFDRIRRVISEPRQVIWVYDQDAWASWSTVASAPFGPEICNPIGSPARVKPHGTETVGQP